MDTFTEALLSGKTDKIPEEYDWFAPLLGDWDCEIRGRRIGSNPAN